MSCPVTGLTKISAELIKPTLRPDPSIGTEIHLYDQNVIWTSEHLSPTQLNKWRYLGDPVIDHFFHTYGGQLQDNEDTYAFIEQLASEEHTCDESCGESCIHNFITDIRRRPEWFNKEQIQRGQKFFLAHSPTITMSTFSYTLVLGYGFQQLNDVLTKTQYLSSSDLTETYDRLIETLQMIARAMLGDVDNFDETFLDVIRVRLLHGMVRYKFKKHIHQVPINQEDSLITLLGFSFGALYCLEERIGIRISMEDKQCYLHLWRYIGWLMGIKDEFLNYLSSYESTRVISESIFYHFYLPTKISKHLVHHSLSAVYACTFVPISYRFHLGLSQTLLGEQLSQALGIDQPKTDLLHRCVIFFTFRMFRFMNWLIKLNIPSLTEWIIQHNKEKLILLIHKKPRNFSLFKTYKSNSNTIERKSLKDCPCGYGQKKHQGTMKTNDIAFIRCRKPISSTSVLRAIFFSVCFLYLFR